MDGSNVVIRSAASEDVAFLQQKRGLSPEILLRKISRDEILILGVDGDPIGQLWFAFLWSEIPFIDLIYIKEDYQDQGLSHVLLGHLEDDLHECGYTVLYSSSQMDEPAPQAWHRHMGFAECGVINSLNEGGIGEVFFRKSR
jgi:N-acetylglutamate synthase-like GNAT family acetyltransferase